MTAKEYLNQIKDEERAIEHRREELQALEAECCSLKGVDYTQERIKTSGPASAGFTEAVERLEAVREELVTEIADLVEQRQTIIRQIEGMENSVQSELLYRRYVKGERLDVIAEEMSYSIWRIQHMHGEALREFERLYLPGDPA